MDYQELIDELHCFYQIQETSRKKLDDDETEADDALSVVIFVKSAANSEESGTRQRMLQIWRGQIQVQVEMQVIWIVIGMVEMEIQVLLMLESFMGTAITVVQRDTRRLIAGKRMKLS